MGDVLIISRSSSQTIKENMTYSLENMLDLFNNKMASFFFFYSVLKVVQQRTSVRGELEGQSLPSHIFSG